MTLASGIKARRRAAGFTLIEVTLAAVLGLIVILIATGVFRMMDRAKQSQAQRMENNLEFASAHRIIQQSMRTLLMADTPEPRDAELKERIVGDLESATAERENMREESVGFNRFTLQPEPSKLDVYGRPMQTLELALKVPPVRGNVRSLTAAELREREQMMIERFRRGDRMFLSTDARQGSAAAEAAAGSGKAPTLQDVAGGRGGKSAIDDALAAADGGRGREAESNRSGRRGEDRENRRGRLRETAREFAGREISEDALAGLLQASDLPARAPGVRGVFEFRPEDDPNVLKRAVQAGDPDGGRSLWAMWWREFPAGAEEGAGDADLAELARYSRSDVREVKLISGLRQARWQVFRTSRGEKLERARVSKIAALHAKELPAFVELKFETMEGRQEHWMFEVAWSTGPEPGSLVQGSEEALNAEQAGQRGDQGSGGAGGSGGSKGGPSGAPGEQGGGGGGGKGSKGHTTIIDPPK